MMNSADIIRAAKWVTEELQRANAQHKAYHSLHEGYAVLLEEVDELWEEVRKRRPVRDKAVIWKEAGQIAAVALRIMVYLGECPEVDSD